MNNKYVLYVESVKADNILSEFKQKLDFGQLVNAIEKDEINESILKDFFVNLQDFLVSSEELDGRDRIRAFAVETFKTSTNPQIRAKAKEIVKLVDDRNFEYASAEIVSLVSLLAQPKSSS